jgi:tripartite-type tricarboxylate transporter receptor subunit TctC
MTLRLNIISSVSCSLILGVSGLVCHAQTFPSKPVRLIVAQSPGGGADATARLLAADVSAALGRQLVVENRAGGGGRIGAEVVARAAPDGYTVLFITATFPVSASVFKTLPFDPVRDFAPISLLVRTPSILAVHPSLPVRSVKELIALAKANPGKINYAGGIGSTLQLFTELFKFAAKIDMVHVPYNGTGPAMIGVLSGESAVILAPGVLVPYVRSERLRVLAIATAQRSPALPELPTIAESGLPGFEGGQWFGAVAPAGTPDQIISRLNNEFVKAVRAPRISEHLVKEASTVVGSTPQELATYLKQEVAKWTVVVKSAGIRAE